MKRVLTILMSVLLLAGCSNNDGGSTPQTKDKPNAEPTAESTTVPTAEPEQELTFGSCFSFDDFELTILDEVEWGTLSNQFSDKDGSDVFFIPFHIKNNSDETGMLNIFYVKYFGSQGIALDDVSSYFEDSFGVYAKDLRSGAETDLKFPILYDGDGDYYIEFSNFTEKIEVRLPITK